MAAMNPVAPRKLGQTSLSTSPELRVKHLGGHPRQGYS